MHSSAVVAFEAISLCGIIIIIIIIIIGYTFQHRC